MSRKVIIDTDPGQDDAVALMVALASPELDVVGITVVAGNVPLERTGKNARAIRDAAGRSDVPVVLGASHPLERPLVTAEYVHGPTGLDGADLPAPKSPVHPGNAAQFIVEQVMAHPPEALTLATLGPLTNVAFALDQAPEIGGRIREIVMMGGGFSEGGNVTPAAEFNIYVDPQAADRVFRSGIPITVLPLDVTHQVLASSERIERFRALGSVCGLATAGMLEFFDRYDSEKYGTDGAPLHDPCVIGYLLDPTLFAGRLCNVEIEVGSELTMGMTVVDWWGVTERLTNAHFIRSVDADRLFDLLIDRVGRLP